LALGVEVPAYKMNRDFFDSSMTAQQFMAINVLYDSGHLAQSDLRGILRKNGVIEPSRTDADIDNENTSNTPL